MEFNYTKIKLGNLLYKYCFQLYNITYARFKNKSDVSEINLLKQLIKPGSHVLDIGSNIGFYAKILSGLAGDKGMVYCFEPDSTNFKHLKHNAGHLKNVMLFNNAVSEKKEIIKVYKSKLINVDHRTYPINNYDSIEEINGLSIDSLIEEKVIPKVDLIKIDIQGYELFAFKGMQQLLQNNKNIKILAEYWPHGFKRAGYSSVDLYDFFDSLGYKFSIIEDDKLTPLSKSYIIEKGDDVFEFSFNVLIESK